MCSFLPCFCGSKEGLCTPCPPITGPRTKCQNSVETMMPSRVTLLMTTKGQPCLPRQTYTTLIKSTCQECTKCRDRFPSYSFVEPKLCRRYYECSLEARRNQAPGKFLNAQVADHVCPNFEYSRHRASDSPSSSTIDQVTALIQYFSYSRPQLSCEP